MMRLWALSITLLFTGCALLPEISRQPTLHNPFPQLSRIAVAPFFNLSHEPTLNGRKVASAYSNELQLVPGYEVVPVGVVEQAIQQNRLDLRGPTDVRRLAQLLEVDAVVIGAVTDYSPYYPPRMALEVQWFAANPGFHPIPPGYGLPWGTAGEQDVPAPLLFESELALAKAQLKTQTPPYEKLPEEIPVPANGQRMNEGDAAAPANPSNGPEGPPQPPRPGDSSAKPQSVRQLAYQAPAGDGQRAAKGESHGGIPEDWPDPRGFVPPPPGPRPTVSQPSHAPVMHHTKTYNGHDAEFTTALANYYYFRDDARMNGWQGYLQRSDDFIRFCCHMHIWEMLSARGGAGESRVVWRWPNVR